MGVAAVGVLYATVRRWFGPAAGLLAGAVLALTPVAALMFRFNNPDALLVLLLTARRRTPTVRALEKAARAGSCSPAALVGFGFLTKMLQAFLVVPAFALVYLVAAPTRCGAGSGTSCWPASRCSCRPAGGSRSWSSGRQRAAPTSAARRPTACSS